MYAAAIREAEGNFVKSCAPVAGYISSYFEPLATNITIAASGHYPPGGDTSAVSTWGRIWGGGKAVGEILTLGLSSKIKGATISIEVVTKATFGKKIAGKIAIHHKEDILNFLWRTDTKGSSFDYKAPLVARPDALYVTPAPVIPMLLRHLISK